MVLCSFVYYSIYCLMCCLVKYLAINLLIKWSFKFLLQFTCILLHCVKLSTTTLSVIHNRSFGDRINPLNHLMGSRFIVSPCLQSSQIRQSILHPGLLHFLNIYYGINFVLDTFIPSKRDKSYRWYFTAYEFIPYSLFL